MTKDTPIMADPRAIEAVKAAIWKTLTGDPKAIVVGRAFSRVEFFNAFDAAYLAAQPQETPEQKAGEWRWVPVEPTPEMFGAGGVQRFKNDMGGTPPREAVGLEYKAMLAAAPQKAIPDAEGLIKRLRQASSGFDFNMRTVDAELGNLAADALTAANERFETLKAQNDEALAIVRGQAEAAQDRAVHWKDQADYWEKSCREQTVIHAKLQNATSERAEKAERELREAVHDLEVHWHHDGAAQVVAEAAAVRHQVETIKAETVAECASVAKIGWVSADYDTVGIADADMAMRLCEHIEKEIRALSPATAPMTKGE